MKEHYIVWTDFGSEGWDPEHFDSKEDVISYIMRGSSGAMIVTKSVDVTLED